jgi:hypothetical protein
MASPSFLRAGAASFAANVAVLIGALLFLSGRLEPAVVFVGACLLGFSIGCVLATSPRSWTPLPLAVGALLAAMLIPVPVVLVTYGFALLGLPLLFVYAACVGAGAYMVRRRGA